MEKTWRTVLVESGSGRGRIKTKGNEVKRRAIGVSVIDDSASWSESNMHSNFNNNKLRQHELH